MATKTARKRRRQERRLREMSVAERSADTMRRYVSPGRLAVLGIAAAVVVGALFLLQALGGGRGEPAISIDPVQNPANENLFVSAQEGNVAPNFEATDLSGKRIRLSDLQGKAVLLNFYASWCVACRKEMPATQRVYEKYQSQGFEVLGVNLGESAATARGYLESLDVRFNAVLDPDQTIVDRYRVRGPPVSVFIDRDGIIRKYVAGEIDERDIDRLAKALVEASPSLAEEEITPVSTPVIRPPN